MEKQLLIDQEETYTMVYSIQQKNFSYQENHEKITVFIKNLKTANNQSTIYSQTFNQIKKVANLLLTYLSQDKIQNHSVYFQALASLDSLLSTFKQSLYSQLNFDKAFYKNIQKQFEQLCLNLQDKSKDDQNHIVQFQLYSIFYLIVMLIYFSGKKCHPSKQKIPLKIMSKPFINSFFTLNSSITQKNERIISLVLAYLAKNINLKIYGQRMLKFIMEHFDQVRSSKTLHHFIYSLRQIHLQRQISLKMIAKYGLMQKLAKVLINSFFSAESLYVLDYLNLLLIKHPVLCQKFQTQQLLNKFLCVEKINEMPLLQQDLLLQIQFKLINLKKNSHFEILYEKCLKLCHQNDYCLKVLMQIAESMNVNITVQHIFQFLQKFNWICENISIKGLLFGLQIFGKSLKVLSSCNNRFLILCIKQTIDPMLKQLIDFPFCRKQLNVIERMLDEMISIQNILI